MNALAHDADDVRRPGRPRDPEVDKAIAAAALEEFIECGWDGLTVEGVAARAGVGKTTIYRRFPCKLDLILAASAHLVDPKWSESDTGSLESDLSAMAHGFLAMLTTPSGRAIPATIAAINRHEDLARIHTEFIAARRRASISVVERAVDRGEVPPDTDASLLVDLVIAPLLYRTFVSREPVNEAYIGELVARVVRAFV